MILVVCSLIRRKHCSNLDCYSFFSRDMLSSRGKDKSSAPPVQGLMDQSSSAMFPTPDGRVSTCTAGRKS